MTKPPSLLTHPSNFGVGQSPRKRFEPFLKIGPTSQRIIENALRDAIEYHKTILSGEWPLNNSPAAKAARHELKLYRAILRQIREGK